MEVSALSVVAAIVTATFVFYIRSCLARAEDEKVSARRLHGYIALWQTWSSDNEIFQIMKEGFDLHEEIEELINSEEGLKKAVDREEEKKEEVRENIRGMILNPDRLQGLRDEFDSIPTALADRLPETSQRVTQNLIEGKTFITDHEAASIGRDVAIRAIEMKTDLCEVIGSMSFILSSYKENKGSFDFQAHEKRMFSAIWKGIRISKNMKYLEQRCESIERTPIAKLAKRRFMAELR